MEREIVAKLKSGTSGITLVALVVTIVVLIILAIISINLALGEKGIIQTTQKAKVEYTHQEVWEAMGVKYSSYKLEKLEKKEEMKSNLIEYLQEKEVIGKEKIDVGYVINTEKLLGEKVALGNGTDGKNDVYKLEEVTTGTATKENKYKVKYYGESGERELGILVDETGASEAENEEMHKLKVGDYVQLPYNGETLECMVIYDDKYNEDKGTDYGIQMITTGLLGDGLTLGYELNVNADIDSTEREKQIRIAEEKYNNAIITLNEEASKYVDESNNKYVKSARCVGSVPDNPNEESEDYEELYTDDRKYHIKIKGEDSNSESDMRQLKDIADRGLIDSFEKGDFWAASRHFHSTTAAKGWALDVLDCGNENLYGGEDYGYIIHTMWDTSVIYYVFSYTYKFRPVFTVNTKSQATIYGSGTRQDPYRWTKDVW